MGTRALIRVVLASIAVSAPFSADAALIVMESPRRYIVTTEGFGAQWKIPENSHDPFWVDDEVFVEREHQEGSDPVRQDSDSPAIQIWIPLTGVVVICGMLVLWLKRRRSKSATA